MRYAFVWPAEASCTSAIDAARDFVADVGEGIAARSGGLVAIANCNTSNPERDCQRILINKFGLALDVEKSFLKDKPEIPILRIRSWFSFFLKHSCMHILCGLQKPNAGRERSILSRFWRMFEHIEPDHEVFRQASQGQVQLNRALPLVIHGDEGRGRRHQAHFVLSMHSMLGFGFGKVAKCLQWAKNECNFDGHTYTNRFVIATMRKKDYADQESDVWSTLMQTVAEETRFMWETGVVDPEGNTFYGIVLFIIGDWPFLHKCGHFTRSFNNIQKRINVRRPPGGICHLCSAAQNGIPFEQFETRRPDWIRTQFSENPFVEPNPFEEHMLHEPGKAPRIWCFDFFHTMHLGVLKYFVSSVLAMMSEQEVQGNIDDRFSALSLRYKTWCQNHGKVCNYSKISKEMLNWETTSQFPKGTWHKGSLTTGLMDFLQSRFESETFPNEPLLGLAGEACLSVQEMIKTLYRSSLWIEVQDCKIVAELGFRFLRRYQQLAALAKSQGRRLFYLQPKHHCLQHFLVDLLSSHERGVCGMNPLATSCQPSEDLIGRPSRLCRRVTSQKPCLLRIMDRYLESAYAHFVSHRYLVRPTG